MNVKNWIMETVNWNGCGVDVVDTWGDFEYEEWFDGVVCDFVKGFVDEKFINDRIWVCRDARSRFFGR